MAIKPKKKSYEIDIFTEAEAAMDRAKDVEERPETERGPWASPLSKWHAGVDMEKLPAMTDAEEVLFNKLRQRGTYVVVIKKGRKYYLDVDPEEQINTKMVEALIKKDWLHASVSQGRQAYFVTAHMVYGWRKRIGI